MSSQIEKVLQVPRKRMRRDTPRHAIVTVQDTEAKRCQDLGLEGSGVEEYKDCGQRIRKWI